MLRPAWRSISILGFNLALVLVPATVLTFFRMKILHIDTEKGFRGGEGQVMTLLRGLAARGIDQALMAAEGEELARRASAEGFDVIGVSSLTKALPSRAKAPSGFDLVHAHTGNAHTLALKLFAGRAPILVTRRVDFPVKRNYFSRRKYTHPQVHFIAISNAIAEVLKQGGVDPARIAVVPSGVDPTRFRGATGRDRLRREWSIEEPGPVIGFIGAYVDHKDPLNLIRAAAKATTLPRTARFVFVGEGQLRAAMEEQVRRLNVGNRVLLTGWREDIGDCLAAFDMFVMPSKLEGLCTSLLDAQAVGLPCVACAAGGIPDIITEGENGLLVPPQNAETLSEAIERLWNNEAMRAKFHAEGPRVVEARFSIERMVQGSIDIYGQLVG